MITQRRLRHLLTLVKQAYFGRAAGVLNISQPAHTKSIEVLESELVVTLLEFRWVALRLPARVAANLPRSIRRAGKIDVVTGDSCWQSRWMCRCHVAYMREVRVVEADIVEREEVLARRYGDMLQAWPTCPDRAGH